MATPESRCRTDPRVLLFIDAQYAFFELEGGVDLHHGDRIRTCYFVMANKKI